MGVIKNLMVRIGADARGFLSGMRNAANATSSVSQTINKHMSNTKRVTSSSFASSKMSLKEYTAAISQHTQHYRDATQGADRLSDKIQQLEGVYETVRNATQGMDVSKPLAEQISTTEKALDAINAKIHKTRTAISAIGNARTAGKSARLETLQIELRELMAESEATATQLQKLDSVAASVGESNIGYVSADGMKQLEGQIITAKNELSTMRTLADEAKAKLQSMGVGVTAWQLIKQKIQEVKAAAQGIPAAFASISRDPNEVIVSGFIRLGRSIKQIPANILGAVADGINRISSCIRAIPEIPGRIWNGVKNIGAVATYAAVTGVKKLGNGLKSLAGSAVRGLVSIPSKLRKIGTSASGSCGGLGKMVRSIRNIGIASLGMRIAGGMFGRLRSIISSYISTNEELNASVTSLRNQFGEALLPAIKLVLVAVQKLMPAITAVSNGINSVLTSLFGDMLKTTAGIKKAADAANSLEVYSFDQITKVSDTASSDQSNTENTEAKQSALVQKLTGWIQKLKAAFVAGDWRKLGQTVGDGINSVFDKLDKVDIGGKLGSFINNLVTTAHGALSTVDFSGIGTILGKKFTNAVDSVDWNLAGKTIGMVLTALPTVLVGFVLATNWGSVGQSLGESLKAVISTGTAWIQSADWLQIGKSAADLIAGVDWSGIVAELFSFFGAALGAGVGLLWGCIGDAVASIRNYFTEKIRAAGGNVGKGLLNGIRDGLGSIGTWISKNVISPFVAGFSGLSDGVVEVIEKMINTVIGGINKLLSGLNKFFALGEKVGIDFQISPIKEVKLPRAARGTIVSRATKLEVGEDGTEAVMPLERHTEWMDVFATKLTAKMSGGGSGGTAIIQIILGNRKLTEYFIKDINQLTQENGVCPIHV